jgi:5-methylcytosine-specific restriction protein A
MNPARSGRPWRRARDAVLQRDGWVCQLRLPGVCLGVATTADHIRTVHAGGNNDPRNLRASCAPCNLARENRRRARPAPGWLATSTLRREST